MTKQAKNIGMRETNARDSLEIRHATLLVYPDETLVICCLCHKPFCYGYGRRRSQRVDRVDDWGDQRPRWGWAYQVFECQPGNGHSESYRVPMCEPCSRTRRPCPHATGNYKPDHFVGTNWHPACGSGWADWATTDVLHSYDIERQRAERLRVVERELVAMHGF
jgi:hypothetical protein